MKPQSKLVRTLFVGMILAILSVAAFADSNGDPRVVVKDAPGGTGVQKNFNFTLPGPAGANFTGDLNFTNSTSQTWTSLALFESAFGPTQIKCGGGTFFNDCMAFTDPQNTKLTEILFTNTVGHGPLGTGIVGDGNFTLGFTPVNGTYWKSGTTFHGVAGTAISSVPEPSTLAFLFTGIGAIATRRKLWKAVN